MNSAQSMPSVGTLEYVLYRLRATTNYDILSKSEQKAQRKRWVKAHPSHRYHFVGRSERRRKASRRLSPNNKAKDSTSTASKNGVFKARGSIHPVLRKSPTPSDSGSIPPPTRRLRSATHAAAQGSTSSTTGTTIISEHSQVTSDPNRYQSPLPTRSRHALVSTTTEVIYLESQSQIDIPVPTEVVDLTQDSDDEAGVQASALQPGNNTSHGVENFIVDDMVPGHRLMLRLIDQARSVNDFFPQDKDWVLRRSRDAPMFRSDINHYDGLVGMARFTNAVHAQHQKTDTELGGACGRVVQKLCDLQFGLGALQGYLDKHGSDRFIGHCRRSCKAINNPFRSVRFKEFMNQLGQLSNLANHKRKRILLVIMGVDGSFIDLIYWHKLRHVLSETHHIDVCFYFDKHAGFSPIMPLASLLEDPFGEPLTAYFFTRLVKLADARRRPHGPDWRDEYRDGDKERNSLANIAQAT